MTDLSSLVAKLEAATVPTRELFDEIGRAIESADSKFSLFRFHQLLGADAFLEAAIMLVPDGLPWMVRFSQPWDAHHPYFAAYVQRKENDQEDAVCRTPALALCIAALKARSKA